MFYGEIVDNKCMKILNRCSFMMLLAISFLIVDTSANAQTCSPGYIPTYSRGPNGERGAFLKCIKSTDFQNQAVNTSDYNQAYANCQSQGRYTIDTGAGFRCGGKIANNNNDHTDVVDDKFRSLVIDNVDDTDISDDVRFKLLTYNVIILW